MDSNEVKEIISKVKYFSFWWYLKQLLPLTYRSVYQKQEGKTYFCVWNMWFGRCFNIDEYEIKE